MDSIYTKARRLFRRSWVFVVAALCFALAFTVYQVTAAQMSRIYDRTHTVNTVPMSQRYLLAFAGDLSELDTAETFPVSLKVDGDKSILTVSAGTVEDVLFTAGVQMGPYDKAEPSLDTLVEEFDEIFVIRRERILYSQEEAIPYSTIYSYSPSVKAGEEVVQVEGVNGCRVATYAQLIVSGNVDEEMLLSNNVTVEPITREILMGFRSKPVSSYDFKATFDDAGEPLDCVNVIRSQRAAGYSAGAGAGTASGLPAGVGHVAVNPNVIPYGSKLFIQSTDGSFVYGYAIAADTGTALMNGAINVDLFFGSYQESAANGIRDVDIFVLE